MHEGSSQRLVFSTPMVATAALAKDICVGTEKLASGRPIIPVVHIKILKLDETFTEGNFKFQVCNMPLDSI